jgi:signal transduction histidine kinase
MIAVDPLHAIEWAYVLDEATSALRHDARNKLASIRNMAFYLQSRVRRTEIWEGDTRVPRFFEQIDAEVVRADGYLEELTSMSAPLLGTKREDGVSVSQCVNTALECSRLSQFAVEVDLRTEEGAILVDPRAMALGIRVLIENAAEAMGGRGVIAVQGRIDKERYAICVTDNGPGIPDPEKALRPFFTTKEGHLGLGLNVARRIVKRHGGELLFGGGKGGAEVTLLVPQAALDARTVPGMKVAIP